MIRTNIMYCTSMNLQTKVEPWYRKANAPSYPFVASDESIQGHASSLICFTVQSRSELTPNSFQSKFNFLQLLCRRLPRLKHAQQLLYFIAQLLLDKVFFQ